MIEFLYNDGITSITTSCRGEQLGSVVNMFRSFLIHAGYHPSNVERILYVEGDTQGFRRGDGNPAQGDFFADADREPDAGELGDDEPWEHG